MCADDDHSSSNGNNGAWLTPLIPISEASTLRPASAAPISSAIYRTNAADEQLSSSAPLSLATRKSGDVDRQRACACFPLWELFELPDLDFLAVIRVDDDEDSSDAVVQEELGGDGQDTARVTQTTTSVLVNPGPYVAARIPRSGIQTMNRVRRVKKNPAEQQQRKEGKLKWIRKCVKRELEYLQVQVEALKQQLEVL